MTTKPTAFDSAYLDKQYNNRLRVPDFLKHVHNWQADSAVARNMQSCLLDVRYGDLAQHETLDIFPASGSDQPVLVFIHGGYWRSMDKADHAFVAPAFTQTGACVVIPNYPLCPAVTIEDIVLSQVHALAWIYRNIAQYGGNPERITVVGHSAGGHLAAMMLSCLWHKHAADLPARLVKNALSLSGLHDLAPIQATPYLQNDLHLSSRQVRRCSPAYFPQPQGQLVALCGGDESDEFKRQNKLIEQVWGKRCVVLRRELAGLNHFSVLESLCTSGTFAFKQVCQLLQAKGK
jgi:arylformamidase